MLRRPRRVESEHPGFIVRVLRRFLLYLVHAPLGERAAFMQSGIRAIVVHCEGSKDAFVISALLMYRGEECVPFA